MGDYLLSDVADIVDCEHKTAPTVETGNIYSIRTTDISNGKIVVERANRISEETYVEWTRRAIPQAGDIILAREAPVGEVGWIKRGNRLCLGQRTVLIRPTHKGVDNRFLLYYLVNPETKCDLQVRSAGSVVAHLNMKDIRNFPITLPGTKQQKAIASVLSSLDDKIDLLHRQNKTLEAMAETLFRHWFVEEAQEDWADGSLGDVAVNPRDGVKPSDVGSETKYIGLEHIDRRNIALTQSGQSGDVTSQKFRFSESDILFGKLRPYFHKVCFAPHDGVCSTDILVIRPKKPEYFAYCLFAFYQNDVVEYANLGSGGTRMPRTNWDTLSQYPMQIPDVVRLRDFNQLAIPSINKIKKNIIQIQILIKLRDTLLPKLMSGEVRVAYEQ